MSRAAIVVGVLACLSGCAELTPEQRALEVTYQAIHLVDGMQTASLDDTRDKYHAGRREVGMAGAVLGHHPTKADALEWYAVDAGLHLGITYALRGHPVCERIWQGVSIGVAGYTVARNFSVGIGFGYPLDEHK